MNHHQNPQVLEAIHHLRDNGFMVDFRIEENCLKISDAKYKCEEFEILEVFKHKSEFDNDQDTTIYGIESTDGVKGILITTDGMEIDGKSPDVMKKLEMH